MNDFDHIAKNNDHIIVQAIENWTKSDTGITQQVIFNYINSLSRHILSNQHSFSTSQATLKAFDYSLHLIDRLISRGYSVPVDDLKFSTYIETDIIEFLDSENKYDATSLTCCNNY